VELTNNVEAGIDISGICIPIAEASLMPMAALQGATHILRYVNPAFCRLTGKTREELIGTTFADTGLTGKDCASLLDRVCRTGQGETYLGQDHSGFDPLCQSCSIWPISSESNRYVGIMIQIVEAIPFHQETIAINQALMLGSVHQHELVEEAEMLNAQLQVEVAVRREAEEALMGSQKRYLDLYEFAPIGYLTVDADGLVSEINLHGAVLLAEMRTQILKRRFVQFVIPEDVARYHRLFRRALKQGTRQTFDLALRRVDGSVFHAQLDCVRSENMPHVVRVTIVDITERKLAESEIEQLAFYDSLTQLPNRRFLLRRLQSAVTACVRSLRHGAILLIDLDDFKTINDTRGHFVGDLLLQQVALRLSGCVREGDTVARLGGDEFVVMLPDLSRHPVDAANQTRTVGEKLLRAIKGPYLLAGYEYRTSGSIGTTLFSATQDTLDDLLKRADLALYSAKAAGRDRLRFFNAAMQTAAITRSVMDADFRVALKERQFVLHYQPQVDENGRLTGAEALVRWQHPTRGLVSPADFIAFAEETGLIELLGQWVLETACAQLIVWSARPATAHLRVAINVSAYEFCHPEFVHRVLTAIDRFGIDPRNLMLELTESATFATVEETYAKMRTLKARGIGFSIDDFGSGYSSLSYLKNMPLDQLKLDRSFVSDVLTNPNDAAIVQTIIALGQSLHLDIIAEGVETEAQRAFLDLHGCHSYQGFLFGRPGPAEKLLLMAERDPTSKRDHPGWGPVQLPR
jgi:diguanylate cyclase (GGDEF)-like protein/PAS domain S-box-containing protein